MIFLQESIPNLFYLSLYPSSVSHHFMYHLFGGSLICNIIMLCNTFVFYFVIIKIASVWLQKKAFLTFTSHDGWLFCAPIC